MKPIGIEDLTTEQQEKVRKLSELLEVSTEQAIGPASFSAFPRSKLRSSRRSRISSSAKLSAHAYAPATARSSFACALTSQSGFKLYRLVKERAEICAAEVASRGSGQESAPCQYGHLGLERNSSTDLELYLEIQESVWSSILLDSASSGEARSVTALLRQSFSPWWR